MLVLDERTVSMKIRGVTVGRKTEKLQENYRPFASSFTVYLTWVIQAT
jgi:hypothetical protein